MHAPLTDNQVTTVPRLARLKFAVIRRSLWLLTRGISLNGLYQLSKGFGLCEWAVNYKRRRRFNAYMRRILGERCETSSMRAACRRHFVRTRCDKIFYLVFDLLSPDQIRRRIHFEDQPNIDASLSRGQGVYVALSHFGAQHVSGLLMCFLGYEVAGVRDRNEGPLRQYIQQRLSDRFSEVRAARIFYADAFPRELYRWFQANGILGSALDAERVRNPHLKRIRVSIFGEPREFLTGTLQIALRCGAAVHQGFILSQPNFHYRLVATPLLIDTEPVADDERTLRNIMRQYAANIEVYLRRHPDHVSRI